MIEIEITNQIKRFTLDENRLADAVRHVLRQELVHEAKISLAVVNNDTIHQLNLRYLGHDYPTDVLSFKLNCSDNEPLDGEIVISADTVAKNATLYGLPAADELLLYAVHATLHLVGYDDQTPKDRERMRAHESQYLEPFKIHPHYDEEPIHDSQARTDATSLGAIRGGS